MLGPTFPHWTGTAANAAPDGPSANTPDQRAVGIGSWMTTNGPLFGFDLVRPSGERDVEPRGQRN